MPYDRDKLQQIAGYVGTPPEQKDGPKGSFTALSLGVNRAYGDEEGSTEWFGVAFNDSQVQDFVLANIRKGMAIVVEGYPSQKRIGENVYNNFTAFRVGVVNWFVKGQPAPARNAEDEDL